jgi:hypothetical protein
MKPNVLTYLASPYSAPDAFNRHLRFLLVCHAAATLIDRGFMIFSPISHTHPIKEASGFSGDYATWQAFDEAMITVCPQFAILCLNGWQNSVGVSAETSFARNLGREVFYLDPQTFQPVNSETL